MDKTGFPRKPFKTEAERVCFSDGGIRDRCGDAFASYVFETLNQMRDGDLDLKRWPRFGDTPEGLCKAKPGYDVMAPGESAPGRFYRAAVAAGEDTTPGLRESDRGFDDVQAMRDNPDWPYVTPPRRGNW
jgi:hypothetical protein